MVTLGGSTFAWNAIKQDYNVIETLECLYELCDEVAIVAGGTDGTTELVREWFNKSYNRPDKGATVLHLYELGEKEWKQQQGREKLSYFSNIAIEHLQTDWNFYLQADEIIHEDCFPTIREAIKYDVDAYFCRRLNLWKTPYLMLNVPQERKPCSTEVIRLARTKYRCVDDAESLGVNGEVYVAGDMDAIQIFHMGFVRDPVKHLEKIRHMQTEVFLWGDYDEKAKNCTELQPDRWFDPEKDLIPIPRPLPKFIQAWADERYKKSPE